MSDPTSALVAVGSPVLDRAPAVIDQGQERGARSHAPGSLIELRWAGVPRRSRLRRRKRLQRRAALRRTSRLQRRTPLRRSRIAPASDAQRAKVASKRCLVCGERPVDPVHLVPRSLGGCDDADCVVPLCRVHHRMYDRGELELLPYLEPDHRVELSHALLHVGLVALLRRLTGFRWVPVEVGGQVRLLLATGGFAEHFGVARMSRSFLTAASRSSLSVAR
jgi:hypothetical protein